MSEVVGKERSGIVATHLVLARAERSRAVVVAHDDVRIRSKASLEIRTYGSHEDKEAILLGRMNAHLGAGADEQRTDVERGTALVGGNPLLVEAHHLLHHLFEQLGGNLGHENAATGGLQTLSIVLYAEHAHLAVRTAIGFQAFESLLAIVQAGGCHVQFQILIGADLNLPPLTVAIVATDVVVGLHVTERQICPI